MTLTPLDDFLAHQTPETFDHVATSDRNFFDRYYFNAFTLDGSVLLTCAVGQYPNLNVFDAFISVVRAGKQHIVRGSRLLGPNRFDTGVGPITVRVVDGLRRLLLQCAPGEHGIACDLLFTGVTFPHEEPRFFQRAGNRVVMDYLRFTQCGRWEGWLEVAGERYEVRPERWWGARDHSWGIRPVGEPEPPGALAASGRQRQFFWEWSPQQYQDRCLYYSLNEYADGRRWHQSAAIYPHGFEPEPVLYDVRHCETLVPGTRQLAGVSLELVGGDGTTIPITAEPLMTTYMAGIGYGPPWRHGQYHGPLVVEHEVWNLDDPATRERIFGLTETLCRFEMAGQVGYGVFEFLCVGPYAPLGLS
jgi:hypothetical protein